MIPLLVVSTGRTGTVSIAVNFQDRYPPIKSLHEPFGSRILRIAGNMYAAGHLTETRCSYILHCTYGVRRTIFQNRMSIESNPHICCLLPIVHKLYPNTIVVHVVRNPVDFIRSYINHGAFSGFKGWAGHRIPYWFLRPEQLNNRQWPSWNEMSPSGACAWRWSILNHIIENDSKEWGEKYIRVRYEDLFSEDPCEWMRISEACGLDPSVWETDFSLHRMNASIPPTGNREIHYDKVDESLLQTRCGAQIERYGYSL